MLIVVTGPSGCGKSTILRHVLKDLRGVRFSISHTTRPPRPSEQDGRDYHFVSGAEFGRMIARGRLLEWAEVHGHRYGTSLKEAGFRVRDDVILDIDVQGARQVRALRGWDAVFVFILPPRAAELARRLRERDENTPADLRRRLTNARKEIREAVRFDFVVINDKLDRAVLELEAVILASRCRTSSRRKKIREIQKTFI